MSSCRATNANALVAEVARELSEARALVRGDVANGYDEVERLDAFVVGKLSALLEAARTAQDAAAESVIRTDAVVDRAAWAQLAAIQEGR